MKKFFTSIALVSLVSACAPAKQESIDSASGLSSVTVGTFQTPAGKPVWKKMLLSVATLPAKTDSKTYPFDISSFKASAGGKATNDSIKLPKGDYEFKAEYFDAADKIVYRSCKADVLIPRHIEGKTAAVKIVVCPVEQEVPAGSTDIIDTAVIVEVVLGSETKPTTTPAPTPSPAPKPAPAPVPAPAPAPVPKPAPAPGPVPKPAPAPAPVGGGDAAKGTATLTGTCSSCHNPMGLAAKVVLNSSVIVKLDNTQKGALVPYHGAIKIQFEGENRKNLEAALKTIK